MRATPIAVLAATAAFSGALLVTPARADMVPLDRLATAPDPGVAPQRATPSAIPAGEKADGIYIALQPEEIRKNSEYGGYHYVIVTTDEARAKSYATTGNNNATAGNPSPKVCLQGGADFFAYNQRIAPRPRPVPVAVAPVPIKAIKQLKHAIRRVVAQVPAAPPPPPPQPVKYPSVYLVTTSEFSVGEGGRATLEVKEAWVDLDTLGSRLLTKTVIPYARVSKGPQGLEVYAARQGTAVDVVIRAPSPTPEVGATFQAVVTGGASEAENQCGFLRAQLPTEDGGSMATVVGRVAIPGQSPDDSEPEAAPDPNADGANGLSPMHVRTLLAAISVTQTASEKEPSFSVSYGWRGRDESVVGTPVRPPRAAIRD